MAKRPRINVDVLKGMLKSGSTTKECAEFFKVSMPAISQAKRKIKKNGGGPIVLKPIEPQDIVDTEYKPTPKQLLWLRFYTDPDEKSFMNASAAARRSGYRCTSETSFSSVGEENVRKLEGLIAQWFDEVGLSHNAIKRKVHSLMSAKETKIIKAKGAVHQDDLAEGFQVVGTTGSLSFGKKGEEIYGDGDTIIRYDPDALGIQTKATELAARVQGAISTEKLDVSGEIVLLHKVSEPDPPPIELTEA